METSITLDAIYVPSQDVVYREIEGEIIIVPLASGMGDTDDELYSLNETGQAIWAQLDGRRSLRDVAAALSAQYEAPAAEIETDVLGLVGELVRRRMLVEAA
jgi:hypothetical protein